METVDRVTRKSLPLSPRDLRDLQTLRGSAPHRAALSDLAGAQLDEGSSEAAVLHAVWAAGMRALIDRVEDEGYVEMAADLDRASRQAAARRRRPTWADEE